MTDPRSLTSLEMGHVLVDLGRVLIASNASWYKGSQYEEDQLLAKLLPGRQGSYVDVGAAHHRHLSNTFKFYRRGWRGLLIEPRPDAWFDLLANRAGDYLYPKAVSNVNGQAILRVQGEISSLEADWPITNSVVLVIEVETLANILRKFPQIEHSCDLCSIDVEGHERQVLEGIDFEKFRPRVMVIEAWSHDGRDTAGAWEPALLTKGYELATETQLNRIYVSCESQLKTVAVPSYPRPAAEPVGSTDRPGSDFPVSGQEALDKPPETGVEAVSDDVG